MVLKRNLAYLIPVLSYFLFSILLNRYNFYFQNALTLGDQPDYFRASKLLFTEFKPHPDRCFGFAFFLGIPYLFGFKEPFGFWPILLNIIFFLGVIHILKKLCNPYGNVLILTIVVLFSMCFGFLNAINFVYAEVGFTFFFMAFLYNLNKIIGGDVKSFTFFRTFLLLGLSCLFRPGTLYFVPVVTLLISLFCYFKFKQIISFKYAISSVFLSLVLTVGFQMSMMKEYHKQLRLSYVEDITWYRYCGTLVAAIDDDGCFTKDCYNNKLAERNKVIANKSNIEMSRISRADRYDAIVNKTRALWKAYKICLYTVVFGDVATTEVRWIDKFIQYTNAILTVIPLMLFGFVLIFKKIRNKFADNELFFIFIIAVFILYTISTNAIAQYAGERLQLIYYPIALYVICFIGFRIFKTGYRFA